MSGYARRSAVSRVAAKVVGIAWPSTPRPAPRPTAPRPAVGRRAALGRVGGVGWRGWGYGVRQTPSGGPDRRRPARPLPASGEPDIDDSRPVAGPKPLRASRRSTVSSSGAPSGQSAPPCVTRLVCGVHWRGVHPYLRDPASPRFAARELAHCQLLVSIQRSVPPPDLGLEFAVDACRAGPCLSSFQVVTGETAASSASAMSPTGSIVTIGHLLLGQHVARHGIAVENRDPVASVTAMIVGRHRLRGGVSSWAGSTRVFGQVQGFRSARRRRPPVPEFRAVRRRA